MLADVLNQWYGISPRSMITGGETMKPGSFNKRYPDFQVGFIFNLKSKSIFKQKQQDGNRCSKVTSVSVCLLATDVKRYRRTDLFFTLDTDRRISDTWICRTHSTWDLFCVKGHRSGHQNVNVLPSMCQTHGKKFLFVIFTNITPIPNVFVSISRTTSLQTTSRKMGTLHSFNTGPLILIFSFI